MTVITVFITVVTGHAQIEDEEKAAKEKKKKKVKEVSHEWQLVNKQKPIWMRTPEEITKEEVRRLIRHMLVSMRSLALELVHAQPTRNCSHGPVSPDPLPACHASWPPLLSPIAARPEEWCRGMTDSIVY